MRGLQSMIETSMSDWHNDGGRSRGAILPLNSTLNQAGLQLGISNMNLAYTNLRTGQLLA